MITSPGDRIGIPHFVCPPEKIVAIVETDAPDRNTPFKTPDEDSAAIAGHFIDFLEHEARAGRIPEAALPLPLQSGVGNIANAVLAGLGQSGRTGLTAYTEVIQDGMLDLIESGTIALASATAFSLSPAGLERFNSRVRFFADRIVLRPQEISNHPEVIRRARRRGARPRRSGQALLGDQHVDVSASSTAVPTRPSRPCSGTTSSGRRLGPGASTRPTCSGRR